jgi:hypothetical protein
VPKDIGQFGDGAGRRRAEIVLARLKISEIRSLWESRAQVTPPA